MLEEEEFVGTGEVVRIEKTEEVIIIIVVIIAAIFLTIIIEHSTRCLMIPSVTRTR